MPKTLIKHFVFIVFFLPMCLHVSAQVPLLLNDEENQRFFTFNEIETLPDSTASLSFGQILSKQYAQEFKASKLSTPKTVEPGWAYWYRIRISHTDATRKNWLLEFMDQTIDSIAVYSPRKGGGYSKTSFGAAYHFDERQYHHKNFTHNIRSDLQGTHTYYIRIVSHQPVNVIVVLRSVNWFIHYALDEYLFFGAFYGMLTVFGLYNLMMFFAIRQKQYLYYVLYNVSIGFYEMCTDGIAYQYVWPNSPHWNQYAYGIALYFASVSGMLFTLSLLHVKARAPQMFKVFVWAIALRSVFFVCCLLIDKSWFNYKIIEIIPLLLACYTGFYVMRKGYWPARFFVVGYSFLFVGFIIKLLIALDVPWLPFGPVTHYSLSFCFIMEMLFISFAIAEKVRALKKKKDYVQRRIIRQMKQNEELKDDINRQLEQQVMERTRELSVKSEVIEQQYEELKAMNVLLQEQSEEISRINVLLEKDNITLHNDIEKVTHDRVMSAEVDFEEFSRIYPDRETCFGFLAKLKWEKGYNCRRCEHTHYSGGHLPYSRRCSKCGYEESVIAYTILQNTRIPINKAFYMIFLMYSTKGKISSHKLSEVLDIRQSTCWAYSSRIKKVMETKKKELRNAGHKGWSKLVIDVDDD